MRVFVTGASGYIGNHVAKAFRAKGHTVYGLVRNNEKVEHLTVKEIWPVVGDLGNPDSYRAILDEVEVAVHCAFDYSDKGVEYDAKTIDTILSIFSRSPYPRSLIYTSGTWVYGSQDHRMVDESMSLNPLSLSKWRPPHEEKVLKAATPLLRTIVIRPGHVYGGVGGLMDLFYASTKNGGVAIVGEGHNRWPMVHVQDLAYAYVSAAERELSRVVLNVVDDSTATVREMAEAIARAANIEGKIHVLSQEEAQKQYGPLTEGLLVNVTVNNSRVKRLLGWQIHHAPFVFEADLHFKAWEASQAVEAF